MIQRSKTVTWTRLDNAGKIFPPTTTKRDTKVFRVSVELFDDIVPSILQQALEKTMESYPVYKSVLRKGLFWYYLDASSIRPVVLEECKQPCSTLYIHNKKSLLFEVTYHRKRINLEVYHAISDGTGAFQFLKTLVTHYIVMLYPNKFDNISNLFESYASNSQKMDDSFNRYYSSEEKSKPTKRVKSHTIKRPKLTENRMNVIQTIIPLDKLLEQAKMHKTSLTIFLTAIFLCAVNKEMMVKERKNPVVAVVPVNLRNYFASESVRNFFGVINVPYNFKDFDGDMNKVIESVSNSFKEELDVDRLKQRMNMLSGLEHNIFARPVPLFLKDIIMMIANKISDGEKTISVSNVGKITMPDPIGEYVNMFDVIVSTKIIQMTMCSFKNNLNISFTSAFVNTDVQMHFMRYITDLGIPVVINANSLSDEEGN